MPQTSDLLALSCHFYIVLVVSRYGNKGVFAYLSVAVSAANEANENKT